MDRFIQPETLAPHLAELQSQGRKVVFTNGVFDLLHLGHVTYLKAARALGDLLVVALNDDDSVRRLKGPDRPLVPLAERAEILLALSCVDWVVPFCEDDPLRVVRLLKPDVLVKGGDWAPENIVGADFVRARGGRVEVIPLVEGRSTTALVARAKAGRGA